MNNSRDNNGNSDSNNNSVIIIRSTESQAFVLGFASDSVAGAVRRSQRPCQQALGTPPHLRLLRTPPNYHCLECVLQTAPRINNKSGNNNNSDSNNNSVMIMRSTESQAFALGFASESVAGAVLRT